MSRKALSPFFALLIFAAHLNCVLEHGNPAAPVIDATACPGDPGTPNVPSPSDDCEHKSGCICQGATLVLDFAFAHFDVQAFGVELAAIQPHSSFVVSPSEIFVNPANPPDCTLPLRAGLRCALLQSFLL